MLVRTFNHLIPQSDGTPTVLSSPTTSSYIPDIPYDDFTHPQHIQSELPHVIVSRRERRGRVAPYPLSISTNTAALQPQPCYQRTVMGQQTVPFHSPRPVTFFDPSQAFNNVALNGHVHSSLAFTPGAHGTILTSFNTQPESSTIPGAVFDELTATQMACMQATPVSRDAFSSVSVPFSSAGASQHEAHSSGSSLPQIRVPRVPSIPQVAPVTSPTAQSTDLAASRRPNGAPHLPDAIPPEPSQLRVQPTGTLAPPSDTFPTSVELLGELSLRDAEAARKDRLRAERRKAHVMHEAETLGYTPTDPETISTHDKKRLYLDCLEQYVIYLHNQLRLAGQDPVPVERVSSGRGLTSRSIRTMIVHLKTMTAKLHVQKREAEIKYDELRAQLGAEADLTAPSFMTSTTFRSMGADQPKMNVQQPILTPVAGPRTGSSSSAGESGVTESNPNGTR